MNIFKDFIVALAQGGSFPAGAILAMSRRQVNARAHLVNLLVEDGEPLDDQVAAAPDDDAELSDEALVSFFEEHGIDEDSLDIAVKFVGDRAIVELVAPTAFKRGELVGVIFCAGMNPKLFAPFVPAESQAAADIRDDLLAAAERAEMVDQARADAHARTKAARKGKKQAAGKAKDIKASAPAIKLAAENGLDLADISGSGTDGQITKPDVVKAIEARGKARGTADGDTAAGDGKGTNSTETVAEIKPGGDNGGSLL